MYEHNMNPLLKYYSNTQCICKTMYTKPRKYPTFCFTEQKMTGRLLIKWLVTKMKYLKRKVTRDKNENLFFRWAGDTCFSIIPSTFWHPNLGHCCIMSFPIWNMALLFELLYTTWFNKMTPTHYLDWKVFLDFHAKFMLQTLSIKNGYEIFIWIGTNTA